jgi:hypothetical protein
LKDCGASPSPDLETGRRTIVPLAGRGLALWEASFLRCFLGFSGGFGKIVVVKLHEEGGVGLWSAFQLVSMVRDFRAVDFDAGVENVTWIGMVCVELDVSADSAGNINRPMVGPGGNLFRGFN